MILMGTIANSLAILAGAGVGILVQKLMHRGIPQRYSDMIMKGISLCVFSIAISGILEGSNMLVTIFSMVFGAVIGEFLDLDNKIKHLITSLEHHFDKSGTGGFAQGFMSATLLFCVGAMAIKGSLDSGLLNDHSTLYAKGIMDGITACLFASTMGAGVMFSSVSVLLYQGSITLLATVLGPLLSAEIIAEMNATGSLLLFGLAMNMLGITKLKLMNYIPAMFLPILFCQFM